MKSDERAWSLTRAERVTFTPRRFWLSRVLRGAFGRRWVRAVYRFATLFSLAMLLVATDVWAVGQALRTSLNRAVVQVENWLDRPPRDGHVTVVLWTETSVAHLREQRLVKEPWPIGYAAHAELLRKLSEYDPPPSALFLDFAFITRRDDSGLDYFLDELRLTVQSGVPVFISCVPGAGPPAFDGLLDLAGELAGEVDPQMGRITFVPATIPDESVVQHYWLGVGKGRHGQGASGEAAPAREAGDCVPGGTERLTAAPAIYNAVLAQPQTSERQPVSPKSPPMSLIYDTRVHDATRIYFGTADERIRCPRDSDDAGRQHDRSGENLLAMLRLGWGLIVDSESLRIPRAGPPILPASAVLLEEPGKRTSSQQDICDRSMHDFLSGRPVLIGSSMAAADDFRDTLTDRLQPSILVHAAALQNLAQFGDRYPREDLVLWFAGTERVVQWQWIVVTYVLVLSLLHAEYLTRRERPHREPKLYFDSEPEPGALTSFLAQRSAPVLAAFIFTMHALDIHLTEILFVAISVGILRRPVGMRAANAAALWIMFRRERVEIEPSEGGRQQHP